VGPAGEGLAEPDLRQRERRSGRVPEERNVHLPTGNEVLHQRRLLEAAEHATDGVLEAALVLRHRVEVHSHRGVFAGGLHDQRKLEVQVLELGEPLDDPERGREDAAGHQQLLGLVLVEGEAEGERAGAGVGEAEEVEERRDGHLTAGIAPDGLAEVEDQVRGPVAQWGDDVRGVRTHGEDRHLVATLPERAGELGSHPLHVRPRLASWVFLQCIGVRVVQERDVHAVDSWM